MSLLPRYLLVLGVFVALGALTVWGYIITRGFDRTQGQMVGLPATTGVPQPHPHTQPATQGAHTQPATPAVPPPPVQTTRIVSLAPAISQMLVDLHMDADIVGKAEYDTSAPAKVRVVGNYQDINLEALLSTKPTMVLMMTGASGVPKVLTDLADKKRFSLYTYRYPDTIRETLDILHDPEADQYKAASQPDLATVLGDPAGAIRLRRTIDLQLQAIADTLQSVPAKPKVLVIFSTSPVMASGAKTVNDELVTIASGINVAGNSKVMAPTYDREKILALSPDVILFLSPDAPVLGPIETDARLETFRGINIPAVTNKRIVLLSDPLILLPSTNLAKAALSFAKAIHPDKAKDLDDAVAKAGRIAQELPLTVDLPRIATASDDAQTQPSAPPAPAPAPATKPATP
jgi:ABC-type Fe3+-hydroxamate transport system substrate-binding protein